jgi:predicted CXXCH cytochrome family protein
MKRLGIASIFALLALVAACDKGAPQYSGTVPPTNPVAVYGECAYCHSEAVTLAANGGHGSLEISCQFCHDDLEPDDPGPGHATVPVCSDCHTSQQTHMDPAAGTPQECLVCHTPHGSPNLLLVDTIIATPQGGEAPILFTNLEGRADGSFASASDPGSGICEVCHTTTIFYPSDGMGEPHFTFPCYTCHPHGAGFAPE